MLLLLLRSAVPARTTTRHSTAATAAAAAVCYCCAVFSTQALMGNAAPVKGFGPEATRVLAKSASATESEDAPAAAATTEHATFAGGCFWGLELALQRVGGVIETEVGYTGGRVDQPTYEEVCRGTTGHAEAVRVLFDRNTVAYKELLTVFWDRIQPTQANGQGNDIGSQYRSAIFYHSEEQKAIAEESLAEEQEKHTQPIATQIVPASTWWRAEQYHQQYLKKGGQCALTGDTTPIRCYG